MAIDIKNPSLLSNLLANDIIDREVKVDKQDLVEESALQQITPKKSSSIYKEAVQIIGKTPVVNESRVAQIKDKIEKSQLTINGSKIAEKMLSLEEDLFATESKGTK